MSTILISAAGGTLFANLGGQTLRVLRSPTNNCSARA
jgi:hypothetical protein